MDNTRITLTWRVVWFALLLHVEYSSADVVCNADGVNVCPANTCCNQATCNTEVSEFHCCTEDQIADDEFGCSNCPECVECTWATWGAWTDNCGNGQQPQNVTETRNRKHKNPGNGAPCPGKSQETRTKQCADTDYTAIFVPVGSVGVVSLLAIVWKWKYLKAIDYANLIKIDSAKRFWR